MKQCLLVSSRTYTDGPLQHGTVLDDEVQEWRSMFDLAVKQIPEVRKAQVPFMVIFNDVTLVKRLVFYVSVYCKYLQSLGLNCILFDTRKLLS